MKKLLFIASLVLLFAIHLTGQVNDLDNILMPGAKLEKLAGVFDFTEGPTADKNGNVYFTDQPNDRIFIWNEKSPLSVFMEPAGRSGAS